MPAAAWRMLGAAVLSALGTGLTLPFLLVYLHSVRGLDLSLAGAVAGTVGLVSLVGNPLGGWLADRIGPRPAVLVGLPVAALGVAGWAAIHGPLTAFAVAAVAGLGVSLCLPAQNALLAGLVEPALRSSVFALGNAAFNLGLGAGGLLAALVVDTGRPGTFVTLYLLDAASFALAAGIVLTVRGPGVRMVVAPTTAATPRAGYLGMVRDRAMVGVWLLTAALVTVGFGQFNSVLPVLVTERLPAGAVGLVFAVNTAAVVLAQLAVLRLVAGRRRTRMAAAIGPLWAACWALVLIAGGVGPAGGALAVFLLAAAVFALGETLLWPALPAIMNDLAPPGLRGRYNGALSLALTSGFVLGPVVGGFALAHNGAVILLVILVLACAAAAPAAVALERLVPAGSNTPVVWAAACGVTEVRGQEASMDQVRSEGPAVVREGTDGSPAVLVLDPAGEGRHGRIPASWENLELPVRVTWLRLPAAGAPVELARETFAGLCAAGRRLHVVAGGEACRLAELLVVGQPGSVLSVVLADPVENDELVGAGTTVVEQALLDYRTVPAHEELAGRGIHVRIVTSADADRAEQGGPLPLGHPAVVQALREELARQQGPVPEREPAKPPTPPPPRGGPRQLLRGLWQRIKALLPRRR